MSGLNDETKVPLRWVVVVGGAVLLVGMFVGALTSDVRAQARRIDSLEETVARTDRRAARIEFALRIKVPSKDLIPPHEYLGD